MSKDRGIYGGSFAAVHEFLAGHQGTFNFFFKWEGNYAVM